MNQKQNYTYDGEIEIDLKELFFVLLEKWYLILLSGLVLALVGFSYAKFMVPEKYQSSTSVYVYSQQNEKNVVYSDLQISTVLAKDYEVIVKGRTVLEGVIQSLDLNMSYEQLNSMVSITVPESTRIIQINVRTTDPYLSQDIADAISEKASKHIASVVGADMVSVVEKANLPTEKCSPSTSKYMMLGGMFGIVAACGILVLLYLLNDTIKTQDDVEKYLGLSTLGIIPIDENLVGEEKRRRRARKKEVKKSAPKRVKA